MASHTSQDIPNALQPNAAPSRTTSASLSLYHNPVGYERSSASPPRPSAWGSLHGKTCNIEEYLELSVSEFGKYDLIEGRLVAREMADDEGIAMANAFKEACDQDMKPGEALVEASMAIPERSPGKYRYRYPDFSIGPLLSDEVRQTLPPACRRFSRTPKNIARLVSEITSYNAVTDFTEKQDDYATAKVPRYLIVHRDKRNAGTPKHNPSVHYGRLKGDAYEFTVYEKGSNERVGSPGPLHEKAEVLLDPSKLRRITERKKEQAELKLQQEQKNRREAEERARVERHKRKLLEARLKELGEPVADSDSSSGCNSPPRKKR